MTIMICLIIYFETSFHFQISIGGIHVCPNKVNCVGVGDDRAFIGNMRINNFGHYKSILKCTSTYICEYKTKDLWLKKKQII
jgi:hypothetical protein